MQNDIFPLMETSLGGDMGGNLVARGKLTYVARPLATGTSRVAMGFLRGLSGADVGDMLPATDPDQPWMSWTQIDTYGQRHLVATTPTLEFDEFRRTIRHGPVRARALIDSLWFVEECLGQNWEAKWTYVGYIDVS